MSGTVPLSALRPAQFGAGEEIFIYNPTTGNIVDVLDGSLTNPDTSNLPAMKISRILVSPDDGGDSDDSEQLSAFVSIAKAVTGTVGQPNGVFAGARNSSATPKVGGGGRRNDACGLYAVGIVDGAAANTGIGAFLSGRRSADTQNADALEVNCANYGTSAGSYNSTGFSNTTGIWVECSGNADSGVGISFGNPFGLQYSVGIGFTGQVTGGKTGGVINSSVRDDSSSIRSLDIRGTHDIGLDFSNAAIVTAAIKLPNSASGVGGIFAENAAGDAQHSLMYYNAFDILVLGANAGAVFVGTNLTLGGGHDVVFGTASGTKIGNDPLQKFAFWNAIPVVQPAAISAPVGGATIDAEARTAIASMISTLSAAAGGLGLTA